MYWFAFTKSFKEGTLKNSIITKVENITVTIQTPNVSLQVSSSKRTVAPSCCKGLIIVVKKQIKHIPNRAPKHGLIPYCCIHSSGIVSFMYFYNKIFKAPDITPYKNRPIKINQKFWTCFNKFTIKIIKLPIYIIFIKWFCAYLWTSFEPNKLPNAIPKIPLVWIYPMLTIAFPSEFQPNFSASINPTETTSP